MVNTQKPIKFKNKLTHSQRIKWKSFLVVIFLVQASYVSYGQNETDFDFYFDHESLVVTKLLATGDFYRDVLMLKEIPHPDKAQGFRWFQIRGNSQLHLIKKDVIEFKKDKSIHLCLSTQNLEGFIEHLMENNVDFYNWPGQKGSVTDRSDGVKQIYLQDPDGYWVEVNTAKHE